MGASAGEPDVDFELSASSDEVDAVEVVGVGTSTEPEASSDHNTPKEPNSPSLFVADPKGVPVSVHSSSEWEAVTTPAAFFLGTDLVARAAYDGVEVPGDTYSGSCLSS